MYISWILIKANWCSLSSKTKCICWDTLLKGKEIQHKTGMQLWNSLSRSRGWLVENMELCRTAHSIWRKWWAFNVLKDSCHYTIWTLQRWPFDCFMPRHSDNPGFQRQGEQSPSCYSRFLGWWLWYCSYKGDKQDYSRSQRYVFWPEQAQNSS